MGASEYIRLISGIDLAMLEILGNGYVIEYCIAVLVKEREKKRDDMILYNYITDCLRVITENTAKSAHSDAGYISNRYADIMAPTVTKELTGDEIARDIFRRAGLKVRKEVREDASV